MSRSWKALLLVGVLVIAAAGSANAAPPFELSLSGPTGFIPGQPLSAPFTGALTAAGVGVPNQTIELFVDNQITATAATTLEGAYAISLPPFAGTATRTIKTVAFRGTPLETSATMTVEVIRYALTVNTAGNGSGSVTSNPGGILCPGTCSAAFIATSSVALTATPRPGSIFAGWSGGGCAGTGICTVTMNAPTSVTATFIMQSFTLTVTRSGTGTGVVISTPAGINCGSDCTEAYAFGTMVSLSASPFMGSTFAGWSGGGCSGTGTCTVAMNASTSVIATFVLQAFPLTVSKAGSGNGTVTSTPGGISCGSDCNHTYNYGTTVTLTANPSFPFSFAGWSGACTGTGSCVVSMTGARNVTAVFS